MIRQGDTVKVTFYKEYANRRDKIAVKTGKVEMVHKDQLWVTFPNERPQKVAAMDAVKVN